MGTRKIRPVHPGIYLREILDELSLSQGRLAHAIGVEPMRISHIIRGQRPVTAEMAIRLGRYFGQSARYWQNLQARYDLDCAEDRLAKTIEREITPYAA